MSTLEKIYKLKEIGLSHRQIEEGAGISSGYLSDILKQKSVMKKTTEAKIEAYYKEIIKGLVKKL
jgi:transcriptional regulator with XRE-family HTH domain